jgi:hypothetical protein
MTLTAPMPVSIAGTGTAVITNPYGSHSSSSHKFLDLVFNWAASTTHVAYREGICNDLYSGQNHERIIIDNVTVYGNGGPGATTSSNEGIGISFGGHYESGSVKAVSPLSGYGGGSNVLECKLSNIFLYGVSFGIHGAFGATLQAIQGSFMNVALFGGFNGTIIDARFEGIRQYLHGHGSIELIHYRVASATAGVPNIELYGGTSALTIIGFALDAGGIYNGTGTKTVTCTAPTICYGCFLAGSLDATLSALAGTDYTGFQSGFICQGDTGCFQIGTDFFRTGRRGFVSLGTPPAGVEVYCTDCAPGSNPCTGNSTGTKAIRMGSGIWKCF